MTHIEVVREALRHVMRRLEDEGYGSHYGESDPLEDGQAALAALDSLEAELAQVREERDTALRAMNEVVLPSRARYREALERIAAVVPHLATGPARAEVERIARAALTEETE